jgi:hypothetical protein
LAVFRIGRLRRASLLRMLLMRCKIHRVRIRTTRGSHSVGLLRSTGALLIVRILRGARVRVGSTRIIDWMKSWHHDVDALKRKDQRDAG